MSLIGIRDMSVLEEPPVDRLPIQTYVMEYNDEMVREAIHRELARADRYIMSHNRVNNIDEVANHVAALVPEANVVFAHGQMHEHELEKIMLDFVEGNIDVLVSTTIIETGLTFRMRTRSSSTTPTGWGCRSSTRSAVASDVPGGLRMRFSCTGATSCCVRRRKNVCRRSVNLRSWEAVSRLRCAIWSCAAPEIFWGAEQHGHMQAVGYDLYCKLLNEAVLALR